jgi:outer membrane lipoprotein SlyB
MESEEILSVIQEVENDQYFRPGDRIRLLRQGGVTRVAY